MLDNFKHIFSEMDIDSSNRSLYTVLMAMNYIN